MQLMKYTIFDYGSQKETNLLALSIFTVYELVLFVEEKTSKDYSR